MADASSSAPKSDSYADWNWEQTLNAVLDATAMTTRQDILAIEWIKVNGGGDGVKGWWELVSFEDPPFSVHLNAPALESKEGVWSKWVHTPWDTLSAAAEGRNYTQVAANPRVFADVATAFSQLSAWLDAKTGEFAGLKKAMENDDAGWKGTAAGAFRDVLGNVAFAFADINSQLNHPPSGIAYDKVLRDAGTAVRNFIVQAYTAYGWWGANYAASPYGALNTEIEDFHASQDLRALAEWLAYRNGPWPALLQADTWEGIEARAKQAWLSNVEGNLDAPIKSALTDLVEAYTLAGNTLVPILKPTFKPIAPPDPTKGGKDDPFKGPKPPPIDIKFPPPPKQDIKDLPNLTGVGGAGGPLPGLGVGPDGKPNFKGLAGVGADGLPSGGSAGELNLPDPGAGLGVPGAGLGAPGGVGGLDGELPDGLRASPGTGGLGEFDLPEPGSGLPGGGLPGGGLPGGGLPGGVGSSLPGGGAGSGGFTGGVVPVLPGLAPGAGIPGGGRGLLPGGGVGGARSPLEERRLPGGDFLVAPPPSLSESGLFKDGLVDADGNPLLPPGEGVPGEGEDGVKAGEPGGSSGAFALPGSPVAGGPGQGGVPFFPPMAGGGMGQGGQGQQPQERERTTWLSEDEKTWGLTSPHGTGVIGADLDWDEDFDNESTPDVRPSPGTGLTKTQRPGRA